MPCPVGSESKIQMKRAWRNIWFDCEYESPTRFGGGPGTYKCKFRFMLAINILLIILALITLWKK